MQNYIIANRTDVGVTRQVNEDSLTTFDSPNGRVVVVCDGMGGQAAGDVASRLACDIIQDILENNTFATPAEAITRAMLAANQGILHRTATNPDLEGMGSTCVMVIIKDDKVYYGWVGDSRIYYFSNGELRQVSHDQSYVQQLVDAGQLSAEEAERHPQKNEITNALGLPTMTPPEICAVPLTPEPGSIMMLCSDGLSGMVNAATMQQVLGADNMSLQDKAEQLVALANSGGGIDNITVQLIEFTKPVMAASKTPSIDKAASAGVAAAKKSNRNLMSIGVGAIVAIILIVGAVWFFKGNDKAPEAEAPTNEQVDETPSVKKTVEKKVVVTEEKVVKKGSSSTTTTSKGKGSSSSKQSAADQLKNSKNNNTKNQGNTGNNKDTKPKMPKSNTTQEPPKNNSKAKEWKPSGNSDL